MDTVDKELVNLGDIKVGNKVQGPDGKPTVVTAAYDEHIPKRMYEIEMEDGQVFKMSGNHLWYSETIDDKKEIRKYKSLAKRYFNKYGIPMKLSDNEIFPKETFINIIGFDKKGKEFIDRALDSMGPTNQTPHAVFDGYMDIVHQEDLMTYSFNSFVDFLYLMKKSILESEGYFYYGKVRTTDEISDYPGDVNIPTVDDVTNK